MGKALKKPVEKMVEYKALEQHQTDEEKPGRGMNDKGGKDNDKPENL